jgi:hypothetical protein
VYWCVRWFSFGYDVLSLFASLLSVIGFSESWSMSDAAVPGVMSVVERIENADIRYTVAFLADELSRSRNDIAEMRTGHQTIMAKLELISKQVSGIPDDHGSGARILWPAPPMMIAACSTDSSPVSDNSSSNIDQSSQSLSKSKSSSAASVPGAKRRREPPSDCIWLPCPFCHQKHWNEKSHVQHVDRSMERYVCTSELTALISYRCRVRRIYSGGCLPEQQLPVLTSYQGMFKDKVRQFVAEYCSHLFSSNDKGVDPLRAERLAAFIAGKQQ